MLKASRWSSDRVTERAAPLRTAYRWIGRQSFLLMLGVAVAGGLAVLASSQERVTRPEGFLQVPLVILGASIVCGVAWAAGAFWRWCLKDRALGWAIGLPVVAGYFLFVLVPEGRAERIGFGFGWVTALLGISALLGVVSDLTDLTLSKKPGAPVGGSA